MLDEIYKYYKKIIYIAAASPTYQNNYMLWVNDDNSSIDEEMFYDSTMKLINYYKKNKFEESDMHNLIKCNKDDNSNNYIVYTILIRN